jgi:hypothetical protein
MSARCYAILSIKRLPNWEALHAVRRHDRREERWMPHVDPERTHLNRTVRGTEDPVADAREIIEREGAVFRAGMLSPATHLVLTASPEFFRPNGERVGEWDPDRLAAFERRVETFADRWFPGMVANISVDLDESTPHYDVIVVPLNRRTTKTGKRVVEVSHRSVFQRGLGKQPNSWWLTRWAEHCADLGLERGRRFALENGKKPKRFLVEHWVELLKLREEIVPLREAARQHEQDRAEAKLARYYKAQLSEERRRREELERENGLLHRTLETLRSEYDKMAERLEKAGRKIRELTGSIRRREREDDVIDATVAAMRDEPAEGQRRNQRRSPGQEIGERIR